MIEIKNLHKAFGQNQVLKGVDITVNKGDVVVVILQEMIWPKQQKMPSATES